MPKATKLKSGNWRVQASKTIDGKLVRRSFTDTDRRKAQLMADEWLISVNDVEASACKLTATKAIDEYCEMNSNILSPSTIVGYRNIQKKSIDDIAEIRLDKLSANRIQKWINDLSAKKSAKTVKNCYGLISAIIRQFCPENIPQNIKLPQMKKPQNRALTESEIKLLLSSIDGNEIEVPILLALWLGLRKSEILALEWSNIDFKNHTIEIKNALVRNENGEYVLKPPKTVDSERTLKLPKFIEQKIKTLPIAGERIFPQLEKCLNTRFFRLSHKLGINCKFHDLRRIMATLGVKLNISDKLMMARGGWSNPQTMKNIYQMALAEDSKAADEVIDNYMMKLMKNTKTAHKTAHKKTKMA